MKGRTLILLIVSAYLISNLKSPLVNFSNSVGMPKNLTAQNILDSSKLISHDAKGKFNVSETFDFDSRASVLRYPIKFMYSKNPMDEEEYSNANVLYVLSGLGYDYNNPTPWELKTYFPYQARLFYKINDNWGVYKLTK